MTDLTRRLEAAESGSRAPCTQCLDNGGRFDYGKTSVFWNKDVPCPKCGLSCQAALLRAHAAQEGR